LPQPLVEDRQVAERRFRVWAGEGATGEVQRALHSVELVGEFRDQAAAKVDVRRFGRHLDGNGCGPIGTVHPGSIRPM
jgi:hypothetical protein